MLGGQLSSPESSTFPLALPKVYMFYAVYIFKESRYRGSSFPCFNRDRKRETFPVENISPVLIPAERPIVPAIPPRDNILRKVGPMQVKLDPDHSGKPRDIFRSSISLIVLGSKRPHAGRFEDRRSIYGGTFRAETRGR